MDLLKSENDENVTEEFSEACITGDLDKVTNLLSRKEKIDVKQLDKYFTLQRAVMYDHSAEIVELLLKIGVNANQKDGYFRVTPLQCACVNGNLTIAKKLLVNGQTLTQLRFIIRLLYTMLLNTNILKMAAKLKSKLIKK